MHRADTQTIRRLSEVGTASHARRRTQALNNNGYEVMQAPLQGARPTATLRHDPRSLALAVMRFYRQHRRD